MTATQGNLFPSLLKCYIIYNSIHSNQGLLKPGKSRIPVGKKCLFCKTRTLVILIKMEALTFKIPYLSHRYGLWNNSIEKRYFMFNIILSTIKFQLLSSHHLALGTYPFYFYLFIFSFYILLQIIFSFRLLQNIAFYWVPWSSLYPHKHTVQPRLSWKLRCRCQSLLCSSFLFWIFYLYFWFLLEALKSILGQLEPANLGSLG